ncbi:putative neurofilament heavy polypeptide [Cocos nucifera]|uniref:Putative neurofilament heavy polypeptide n=1 Tax=Cocos nucifera TaxID=13894 RepID=A0A8K0IWS0_COCNU|nr:putative neurofilament heavy polypeptide [Cocos nucifera]
MRNEEIRGPHETGKHVMMETVKLPPKPVEAAEEPVESKAEVHHTEESKVEIITADDLPNPNPTTERTSVSPAVQPKTEKSVDSEFKMEEVKAAKGDAVDLKLIAEMQNDKGEAFDSKPKAEEIQAAKEGSPDSKLKVEEVEAAKGEAVASKWKAEAHTAIEEAVDSKLEAEVQAAKEETVESKSTKELQTKKAEEMNSKIKAEVQATIEETMDSKL